MQSLILFIARRSDTDLLYLAYNQIGIMKFENSRVSGEDYVRQQVLPRHITRPKPVLFDVGANSGEYALALRKEFPLSEIFIFEPNPHSFEILQSRLPEPGEHVFPIGLGSAAGHAAMYTYGNAPASAHASLLKPVLEDIHHASTIAKLDVELTTLDDFCLDHQIDRIDFMKIDTEGYEKEVLLGSGRMLAENRIGIIQFEFNEMNIYSRVFLRDFYDLLLGFDLFRVDTERLIPLARYDSFNEIFKFQNILAIRRPTGSPGV